MCVCVCVSMVCELVKLSQAGVRVFNPTEQRIPCSFTLQAAAALIELAY